MTRVLIVDDDAGLRQSLGLLLGESGFTVTAEGDPERGLARALADDFDVVLCDIKMPKLDGREFLRRYKGEGGRALVVMMSAHGNEELAVEAMREGAYDYLHKPFRPAEVILTLRKAEEREGLRREVATLRASLESGGAGLVAESAAMRQGGGCRHAGGGARHDRPPHRGERHREGGLGAAHPPAGAAERGAIRRRQLRRHPRPASRIGALRAPARRFQRRDRRPERALRGGGWRDPPPRRDRGTPAAAPGQAAPRA